MSAYSGFFSSSSSDTKYLDDQVAISDAHNNSFLDTAVSAAENTYDTMYDALKYLIKAKANSLSSIDKQLSAWEKQLQKISSKYQELLNKFDDASTMSQAAFTLDLAKQAWDVVIQYPILRRYLGEANYWQLFDLLGLLATEGAEITADVFANVKQVIKACILATLAMTDGLMHLESYLSLISQAWGALYLKVLPLPLTDSIVPNVTGAYYYKPADAYNPVPGFSSFAPVPLPIYDVITYGTKAVSTFRYNDPTTYYVLKNSAAMLKAYRYWTSSYTNSVSLNTLMTKLGFGFGSRHTYLGGNGQVTAGSAPLHIFSTLHQLNKQKTRATPRYMGEAAAVSPALSALSDAYDSLTSFADGAKSYLAELAADTQGNSSASEAQIEALSSIYDSLTKTYIWPSKPNLDAYSIYGDQANDYYQAAYSLYAKATAFINSSDQGVAYTSAYSALCSALNQAGTSLADFNTALLPTDSSHGPWVVTTALDAAVTGAYAYTEATEYSARTTYYSKLNGSYEEATSVNSKDSFNSAKLVTTLYTRATATTYKEATDFTARTTYYYIASTGAYQPIYDITDAASFAAELASKKTLYIASAGFCCRLICDAYTSVWSLDQNYSLYTNPDGKAIQTNYQYQENSSSSIVDPEDGAGYVIDHGRKILFPCFGVYGRLLAMTTWDYSIMLSTAFQEQYAKAKSGWHIYYNTATPSTIVYRGSTVVGSDGQNYTLYHKPLASETYTRGSESYTYYVFPSESCSVYHVQPAVIANIEIPSIASMQSIDVSDGTDNGGYIYDIVPNVIPKYPKYVHADYWSVMDLVHELLLLVEGVSPIFGDGGKRRAELNELLNEFGLSSPTFIGQLPTDGEGQSASFQFTVFEEYAARIKTAVDSVYNLRSRIIAATQAW